MKEFRYQKFLGFVVSLSLAGQSLQAAVTPAVAPGMDSAGASGGTEAASAAPYNGGLTSDVVTTPTTRPAPLIMGGISLPKDPITMDFQDADVRDVLHLLAVKSGRNIIYGADVTGPVTVHLDRVPFDQAFQTVLTLKGLVALSMGARVVRVVSSTGLTTEQSQAATFTRVFRLNYAAADDVKKPIDAIRASAGRKGVSTVDTKTNSLIITDTQEGLKEAEDLIPTLDKKPQQVDIESKIVEVTLNSEDITGVTWQYAATAGNNDQYRIGGSQAQTGNPSAGINNTSLTPFPVGPATNVGANTGTGVALNTITDTGFSFLTQQGTYLLGARLAALSHQDRLKVLSTPHIVTTNNEEATITVTNQIPYNVSNVSSNGTISNSVQFVSPGVKLTVKPTINADRRITLHIKPEVSNATGQGSNGLPPQLQQRNADTTIILRDGETIAIGGLIQEQTEKVVHGVPILMSIPILGYLFKRTDDTKARTELIVFLTPKIAGE